MGITLQGYFKSFVRDLVSPNLIYPLEVAKTY